MTLKDKISYYRLILQNRNGINPPIIVLGRIINSLVRRAFYAFDTPIRKKLYTDLMYAAVSDVLTPEQRAHLAHLLWRLGNGTLYYFTDEEKKRNSEMVLEIIAELKAEGRWKA